jgi:hypothetical protein
VSNRAASEAEATPPKSMTDKMHSFIQSKVPGYKPGMNPKQAVHAAFKTRGDNLKAASSMTSSAPAAKAGATTSTPPPSTAGATAGKAPPKPRTPKPRTVKPKTEAAPKVDSTKVKTPTPKPTGPTNAEQNAATTAASTPTPGTPEILKSLFGGTEFEKMLTFMKSITYAGEQFSGYNKPKRTSDHKTKSHAVAAKEGDTTKLIRFGQQGVSGEGKAAESDSKADKARRKSFKARHAKNINRGKMSAAYWADKEKW